MKLCYVTSEEGWEGIYVDDALAKEGHSIRTSAVLDLVFMDGRTIRSLTYLHLDGMRNARLEDEGNLPASIAELLAWPERRTP